MGKIDGRPRIYLGGPDVFMPNTQALGAELKAICAEHGLIGLYPCDNEVGLGPTPHATAQRIFAGNVELMNACDGMIANFTPFRGVSMDVGTAFEIGYVTARGKPTVGWTQDSETIAARVKGWTDTAGLGWRTRDDGHLVDGDGVAIENFGLADNLMPVVACGGAGPEVFGPDPGRDEDPLSGFRAACAALAQRLDGGGTESELERLRRLLDWRERLHERAKRRWVAAAKAALGGDPTDLAERLALAEGATAVIDLPAPTKDL